MQQVGAVWVTPWFVDGTYLDSKMFGFPSVSLAACVPEQPSAPACRGDTANTVTPGLTIADRVQDPEVLLTVE